LLYFRLQNINKIAEYLKNQHNLRKNKKVIVNVKETLKGLRSGNLPA